MKKNDVKVSSGCDGVVCFAGIDWWYHNRGHSECQIMKRLSSRMPVLWVNSIGMRAPLPGKTEIPFRRYARKLSSTLKGLKRDGSSAMWIYSPLFVPCYTRRMLEFNGWFLSCQIGLICRKLGMRNLGAWVTVPTVASVVERRSWGKVLFNRSDRFSAFEEADSTVIAEQEERLFKLSDIVLYVNHELMEEERDKSGEVRYLGHGVDYEHFANCVERRSEVSEVMSKLKGPIIGFYGALDSYTIDLELMIKVARHVKDGTLLVIGPKAMDIDRLLAEPNVVYLGPIPYEELPGYVGYFDIALMPWLRNDWIRNCNPIKLKEYLAAGLGVVTIRFPELKPFEKMVYCADTHEEFIAAIDRALVENDDDIVLQRREAVKLSSWDRLADVVADMFGDL